MHNASGKYCVPYEGWVQHQIIDIKSGSKKAKKQYINPPKYNNC